MHQQWEDQIAFYVAGTLPRAQVAELERHLATCAACQQSLREWRQIAEAVRDEAGTWSRRLPPLSLGVRSSLRQPAPKPGISPAFDAPTPTSRRVRYRRPSRSWGAITLAAAVITLVLFGGAITYLTNRDRHNQNASATLVAMSLQTEEVEATQALDPTPTRRPPTQEPRDLGILTAPTTATALPPTNLPTRQPDSAPVNTQPPDMTRTTEMRFVEENLMVEMQSCRVGSPGEPVPVYEWTNRLAPIVDYLQPGERLTSHITDGAGWYQVNGREGGILGWVPAESVTLEGDCGALLLPSLTPDATRCTAYASVGQPLFLLEGPGASWPTTYILQPLFTATAFERSDNGWVRLMHQDGGTIWIGWVQASELVLEGTACVNLPVIASSLYATPGFVTATESFTPTPVPFDPPTATPPDLDATEDIPST